MSSPSDPPSAAASDGAWSEPLPVPPAKPRRASIQRSEIAVVAGIIVVLAGLLLPRMFPVEITHYRCVVCGAMATERKIDGEAILGKPVPMEETRIYETLSIGPHRHRWSKGMDTFFKDRLTGEVYATASRGVSPVWGLRGDDYRKLLKARVARDGSLAPLEVELRAVEDTFVREGSAAAKERMQPIWEEILSSPAAKSEAEDSADALSTPAAPSREPAPRRD